MLLSTRDVAQRLNVTENCVRRLIRAGRLRALAPAGRRTGYRISEADLNTYVATHLGITFRPLEMGQSSERAV